MSLLGPLFPQPPPPPPKRKEYPHFTQPTQLLAVDGQWTPFWGWPEPFLSWWWTDDAFFKVSFRRLTFTSETHSVPPRFVRPLALALCLSPVNLQWDRGQPVAHPAVVKHVCPSVCVWACHTCPGAAGRAVARVTIAAAESTGPVSGCGQAPPLHIRHIK